MAKNTKATSGLSKKHWFGYMLGDFGGCMTFALMSSFVTRYYTNVLHINELVLFALVMIWNIWDAVNDPLMGALMDKIYSRSKGKKDKFRPWLLRSTPLVAITAIAFWTLPTYFDGITMLVVLFMCKVLYEAAYTMFNIPMGSLLSAMSSNDQERASLSTARGIGSALGNAIPLIAGPAILKSLGENDPQAYAVIGTGCAVIGFVICLMHYFFTEEKRTVTESASEGIVKITDIFQAFKYNRPFVALCIHGICICAMQSMVNSLATYTYIDIYNNEELMSMVYPASAPAMFLIFGLSPWLSKKIGLERLIRYSLFVGTVGFVILSVVVLCFDIAPVVFLIISALALGIPTLAIQMQWGLVAEAIDYNQIATGKKMEGSIYGTFNLARRIGGGIGQGGVVLGLAMFGYDAEMVEQGIPIAENTEMGIMIMNSIVPAIFVLGSWAAFKFVWNITPEIRAKMLEKKNAATAVDAPTE